MRVDSSSGFSQRKIEIMTLKITEIFYTLYVCACRKILIHPATKISTCRATSILQYYQTFVNCEGQSGPKILALNGDRN